MSVPFTVSPNLNLALQGSGPAHGGIPSPFRTSTASNSDVSSPRVREDFGPFEQSQVHDIPEDDTIDGAPDFGAESYTRPRPDGTSTGSGSDSRSRTSASNSNADSARYNHHYLSQQPLPSLHMHPDSTPFEMSASPLQKKKKSKRDKQSRLSVSTTSQSASLASPPPQQASFPFVASSEADYASHREFVASEPTPSNGGFPSAGLPGAMRRKNSEAGVFLANRGDE